MSSLTSMFGNPMGAKPDNDFDVRHTRKDRVGIYCCVCGLEESFYNTKVEKENRTEAFDSEIYIERDADYLLYFCSDRCKSNRPIAADERVPDNRKYLITSNEELTKEDPSINF